MKMIQNSLQRFVQMESSTGILLIVSSILAILLANSPLASFYQSLLQIKISIGINQYKLSKPLILWINDGLMVFFFLLIGLEVKREILEGQLSNWSQVALPAIAALGGILVPVLIYVVCNSHNTDVLSGWAIPAATDIAFALGVLALLGSRLPNSLKIFLMTLAIFDDLAVIIIIAIYYSLNLSLLSLALAFVMIILLLLLNRYKVNNLSPYLIVGTFLWLFVLKSGVHATLAGVILALTIPLKINKKHPHSPLKRLEHNLHYWVMYGILPIFAFANAGIVLSSFSLDTLLNPLALGIIGGLFLGKQIGVFMFSYLAIKFKIAKLPHKSSWIQLYGVAILCGIGFTMSFFICSLTFDETLYADYSQLSRLSILLGSLLSAIVGYSVLRFSTSK